MKSLLKVWASSANFRFTEAKLVIFSALSEEEDHEDPNNSGLHVDDALNKPDSSGRVVVNIGHAVGEEDIYLAPQLSRTVKPHQVRLTFNSKICLDAMLTILLLSFQQIGGIRFLYDNIIESPERFNQSQGFGCILAHAMGLGKTIQIVTFCDIFLRHTPGTKIVSNLLLFGLLAITDFIRVKLHSTSRNSTPSMFQDVMCYALFQSTPFRIGCPNLTVGRRRRRPKMRAASTSVDLSGQETSPFTY